MPAGHPCTRHSAHRKRGRKCLDCRAAASGRYYRSLQESRRKLRQLQEILGPQLAST
jgi:hypothetical protein